MRARISLIIYTVVIASVGSISLTVFAESPAPRSFASYDNLLINASMESTDPVTGVPRGWIVNPKSTVVKSTEDEKDARDGKHSLRVQSTAKTHINVAQSLHLTAADLGKKVTAWAWAQCSQGYLMHISFTYDVDGKPQSSEIKPWPMCADEWTPLKIETVIPPNADPASVMLSILVKPRAGGTCRLDAVRAIVEGRTAPLQSPAAAQPPAPAAPTQSSTMMTAEELSENLPNLIVNASFDQQDPRGRPFGWGIKPESLRAPDDTKIGPPKDGPRCIYLMPASEWGIVSTNVKLPADAVGKAIVADGFGKSPVANALFIVLRCKTAAGLTELCRSACPASQTEWQRMATRTVVPADADLSSMQVLLMLKPGVSGVFGADRIRVVMP